MFSSLQNPLALVSRLLFAVSSCRHWQDHRLCRHRGLHHVGRSAHAHSCGGRCCGGRSGGQPGADLRLGTRFAALVLAFTLVASLLSAYWSVPADQQMIPQLLFLQEHRGGRWLAGADGLWCRRLER